MVSYLTYAALLLLVGWRFRSADWTTSAGKAELLLLAALCLSALVWATEGTLLIDFLKAYYPGGRTIWEQPYQLYECHRSNLCFVNLPILALLFSPFSFMPTPIAAVTFTTVGLVLAACAAWRLSNGAKGWQGRAVIVLFLVSGPLAYSIRLGNMTHMLIPVLLLAFEAQSRGRQVTAGVAMAFVALIKPFCVLFLFYFFARRQWNAFVAMAGSAALVILLSLLLFGVDLHKLFVENYVFGFGSRPVIAYNVQNFAGAIGHLALPGNLKNFIPIDEPLWFKMARLSLTGVTLAMVATTFWRAGQPKTQAAWLAELCIVLSAGLLIAPVTWTHYLSLLLVPLALLVTGRFEVKLSRGQIATLAIAALFISLPVLLPNRRDIFPFFLQRIWISHFVVGMVMLFGILAQVRLQMRAAVPQVWRPSFGRDHPSPA